MALFSCLRRLLVIEDREKLPKTVRTGSYRSPSAGCVEADTAQGLALGDIPGLVRTARRGRLVSTATSTSSPLSADASPE